MEKLHQQGIAAFKENALWMWPYVKCSLTSREENDKLPNNVTKDYSWDTAVSNPIVCQIKL